MRVAIIGAGISGISSGRMLKEKGHDVVIFEKGSQSGGLVRCDRVNGYLFHRTGGHVFNAKDKPIQDWFWNQFDREKEFTSARRNAKIFLRGKFVGYPIENHLYQLDRKTVNDILSEVLLLSEKGYQNPFAYDNFKDFLLGNFGDTLCKLYFLPYNEKIWRTDLGLVPLAWLEGKLPMPDYRQLLLTNVLREGESDMVHSLFYYPKHGGSQFIIDRLAEGLKIICNSKITRAEFIGQRWILNGGEEFDSVIFSGDVRQLKDMICTSDPELVGVLQSAGNLKSNGTSNMLCETDDTDLSWLYLPSQDTKAHRIIYTGNFSDTNNPKGKRKSCVVEFSGFVDEGTMVEEISKLPGNLKNLEVNYEPNSYVIQDIDTRQKIGDVKKLLEPLGLYLVGRFAEWEYYNMDKAIASSLYLTNGSSF